MPTPHAMFRILSVTCLLTRKEGGNQPHVSVLNLSEYSSFYFQLFPIMFFDSQ